MRPVRLVDQCKYGDLIDFCPYSLDLPLHSVGQVALDVLLRLLAISFRYVAQALDLRSGYELLGGARSSIAGTNHSEVEGAASS